MHIGEIIKQYRSEHNLTMEEFGRLIGRSKAYISMLEKNKNSRSGKEIIPSIDTLIAVANVLNITIDELIKQLDDGSPILLNNNPHKTLPQDENSLPELTSRDEAQIAKELEKMMQDLDSQNTFAAHGGTVEDDEDRELLRASLLTTMKLAKQIAKKKFTTKKYRE